MRLVQPELSRRAWLAGLLLLVAAYAHHTLPYLTMMPRVNVDEPWVLERAYEVLRTGRPLQPMLGLDHAYLLQPGYSYLIAPWLAVFGLGMFQARLFGVLLGLGIVLAVAAIGNRLAGRAAGLFAAAYLLTDSNFLGGVRNARTDIPGVFFIAMALWLFLVGRDTSRARWYFASGVASGLAVLCHGNSYWVGFILLAWYAIDQGRQALTRPHGYAYAAGVMSAVAPYLIVVALNWAEVRLQIGNFASDRVPGWRPSFIWQQMQLEPERYRNWYFGLVTNLVRVPVLRTFQAATIGGLVYLGVVLVKGSGDARRRAAFALTLALGAVFIFAGFINNKAHVYMPNLAIGFAVVAGAFTAWAAGLVHAIAQRRFTRLSVSAVVVLLIFAHATAGVAYYEKWYSVTRRSELLPYESTVRTINYLLPAGPKYVFASPHFWIPFAGQPGVTFFSHAAPVPDGEPGRMWHRWLRDERPVFLLIDERQWKPELLNPQGDPVWQRTWIAFVRSQCRLRSYAPGSAYGTLAAYECTRDGPPIERPIFIAGDAGAYVPGDTVVADGPGDFHGWQAYADPRPGAAASDVALASGGVHVKGSRWPGVERTLRLRPGEPYLLVADVAGRSDEDLVYVGRWSPTEVTSLSGGSSGGIVEPARRPDWFPGGHAFVARRPEVRLLFYSERPDAAFTLRHVDVCRLKRVS